MQSNEKNYEFPNNFRKILEDSQENFQKIGNIERNIKDEQKANAFMAEKSYAQDNKSLKNIAVATSYLTSAFSIASGLYFLYSTFLLILYFDILSWIVAGILLVTLEVSKHISTGKSFELFYRGRNIVAYLLFVLILVSLSVLFSIKGVESFYSQVMHEKPLLINTSQIAKDYEQRIKDIEKQRTAFTNSVSWQGQINIYDPQIRSSLSNFDTQIAKLREEKNKNLQKSELQNNQTTQKNESKHITSVLYLILIFGLNEFFCLLSLWFPAHYNFRVDKESKYRDALMSENKETQTVTKETQTVPISEINNLAELTNISNLPRNTVGFHLNNTPTSKLSNNGKQNSKIYNETVSVPQGTVSVTPKRKKIIRVEKYKKGRGFLIDCKNCGKRIYKKSPSAVHCSDNCRMKYHKEEQKEQKTKVKEVKSINQQQIF